jgi:hypothetical protein
VYPELWVYPYVDVEGVFFRVFPSLPPANVDCFTLYSLQNRRAEGYSVDVRAYTFPTPGVWTCRVYNVHHPPSAVRCLHFHCRSSLKCGTTDSLASGQSGPGKWKSNDAGTNSIPE